MSSVTFLASLLDHKKLSRVNTDRTSRSLTNWFALFFSPFADIFKEPWLLIYSTRDKRAQVCFDFGEDLQPAWKINIV